MQKGKHTLQHEIDCLMHCLSPNKYSLKQVEKWPMGRTQRHVVLTIARARDQARAARGRS